MTSFTEVDTGGYYSENSTRINFTNLPCNVNSYVYKSYGASFFNGSGFRVNFSFFVSAKDAAQDYAGVWAITNTTTTGFNLSSQVDSEYMYVYGSTGTGNPLQLYMCSNTTAAAVYTLSLSTVYYVSIVRAASAGPTATLTYYLYSDAAHSTLLATRSLTVLNSHLNYMMVGFSDGEAGFPGKMTGYSQDYDLNTTGLTASTTPATSVTNSSAVLNGILFSNLTCNVSFEYGVTEAYGSVTANQSKADGQNFSDTIAVNPGALYHFRSVANNTYETVYGSDEVFLTMPNPPSGFNMAVNNATTVNISWTKGTGCNTTVLVSNSEHQPSTPSDGTVVYNGSLNYTFDNISSAVIIYYSLWTYANRSEDGIEYYKFSVVFPANITNGGMLVGCYDEQTFGNLTFNLSISNFDGSHIFNEWGCTNYKSVNMSALNFTGQASILISADNHTSRLYYLTINASTLYVLNAYLGEANRTNLYLLRVIDEINQVQDEVSVNIKAYSNTTGIYETVTTVFTDGAGECEVSLISGNLYKVILSKTGYLTSVEDYIPDPVYYGLFYPKSFKIYQESVSFLNESMYYNSITFNGQLNNITGVLSVNYSDNLNMTLDSGIYVYKVNSSDNTTTLISNYYSTTDPDYQYNVTVDDLTACYIVVLYLNHTIFAYQTDSFTVCGNRPHMGITTGNKFNNLFNLVFGTSPAGIGWTNFFAFFVIIACLFSFGQRDCGIGVLLTGFILLFLNSVIGLSFMSVAIPTLFIIVGAMVEWSSRVNTGGY